MSVRKPILGDIYSFNVEPARRAFGYVHACREHLFFFVVIDRLFDEAEDFQVSMFFESTPLLGGLTTHTQIVRGVWAYVDTVVPDYDWLPQPLFLESDSTGAKWARNVCGNQRRKVDDSEAKKLIQDQDCTGPIEFEFACNSLFGDAEWRKRSNRLDVQLTLRSAEVTI